MLDSLACVELTQDSPPLVHGVAQMASLLFAGASFGQVLDMIGPEPRNPRCRAAWLMDRSWAFSLNFSPYQAASLQAEALALERCYRIRGKPGDTRLLALCAPGDLMVNAPLDFIAGHAGLQLDLAFLTSAGECPPAIPDHDVAMLAASESAPDALTGFMRIFGTWPRPILNDPALILPMSRAWLPKRLAGLPGIVCAAAQPVTRQALLQQGPAVLLLGTTYPYLLRPTGSHAGHGLGRVDGPDDLRAYLDAATEAAFTLTQFIDTQGQDGWFRKYRIAFVAGPPFICHMAASEHWMVHYLNAGMTDPVKRAAEAAAMAGFGQFQRRHRAGLQGVADAIGLDYFSIDCGPTRDGRLVVFEADTAAIIHSMDCPTLYPYKRATMQRCYDAFGAMVRQRAM